MPALGPVFRYEMYAAGRRTRYVVLRVLIGLAMLGILWMTYESVRGFSEDDLTIAQVSGLAESFYVFFAWSTLFGVLAVTPVVAAGAIATERERRTIEYLFATDLSNAEIVLDKLLARLLTVGKLVVATLPVLAIFRFLGGLPGDLLLMHFVLLACTATMTASIALTVGVWCDRARDAASRALGAVGISLLALPLAFWIAGLLGSVSGDAAVVADLISEWVLMPAIWAMSLVHPVVALIAGGGLLRGPLGVDADLWAVGKSCLAQLGVSAVLMTVCVTMVRRVHLRAAGAPGTKRAEAPGAGQTRRVYEQRPLLWKEMYAAEKHKPGRRWRQRIGGSLLTVLIGGALVTSMYWANVRGNPYRNYMQETCAVMATLCGSVLILVMGARAAGLISNERERDTWLSLLATPLTAGQIVVAKILGNFYAFRWPLIGVVLIPLSAIVYSPMALIAAGGFAIMLLLIAWAATSIGLAASLRMKSSIKAVGAAILVMLGISAFYPALATTFLVLARAGEEGLAILVLPPLAPFLIAAPMMFTSESNAPDEIVVGFAGGFLFYLFLGIATTMSSVHNLDRLCERGDGSTPPRESLARRTKRLTTDSRPT